ncbi:TIGR02234 family membrane protein [soil metagenome]
MADERRRFAPVVLGALVSGALVAIAGNQSWATIDSGQATSDAAFASASAATRDASAPPVTALALVLLATWGVVLVSRGRARRAVTWLGLLAAVGALGFAVSAWLTTPGSISDAGASVELATSRTAWAYLGVVAGVAAVAMSVFATRSVAAWPEMGRRYDAPGSATAPDAAVPLDEQTNLDLWRAIDEGRDPTEGPTH